MIVREDYTSPDGRSLIRTYSDANVFIIRNDGIKFAEAIDPPNSGRTYTETDEPIPAPPEPA